MKSVLYAFGVGLVFGVGLILAGMTDPARVQGFLTLAAGWDPTLAFVMGAAVPTFAIALRLVTRRQAPLLAPRFELPTRRDLDTRLIGGAAVFGVGWGLAGYCPGPGLVGAGTGSLPALAFVGTMALGMVLHRAFSERAVYSSERGARSPS